MHNSSQEQEYEFGVMSRVWNFKCDDPVLAKVCMLVYLVTDAPIAIYKPNEETLWPRNEADLHSVAGRNFPEYLKENQARVNSILKTIKEKEL